MNPKIGALFITYNPNLSILNKGIDVTIPQVGLCIIVDNGSSNYDQLAKFAAEKKIVLIQLKENIGIAGAQNIGFEFLRKHNYEWVLTLDQDSLIPRNTIEEYLKTELTIDSSTAIITAIYLDRDWNEKQMKSLVYQGKESIVEKKFVISSGNLVRVSAWATVLGFDESLFIDMVDYDFDAKLILAGFKIWQANNVVMNHAVGKSIHKPVLEKLLFLPETGILADHPAFRQYYIYRNSMIFSKRYPQFAHKNFLTIKTLLSTRRMFIYQNTFQKLKASFKGIIDGTKYNKRNDLTFIKAMNKVKKSRIE